MTYDEFVQIAETVRPRNWRLGQTYFNFLYNVRPQLADSIRATELDPFHQDERVPRFKEWLKNSWDVVDEEI